MLKCFHWSSISLRIKFEFFTTAWSPEWSVSPHSHHHLFIYLAPFLILAKLMSIMRFLPVTFFKHSMLHLQAYQDCQDFLSFRPKPKCHLLFIVSFFVQLRLSLSSWPKGHFPQLIFITYPALIFPVALNTTCSDLIHSLALYLLSFVQKHKLWENMNLPHLITLCILWNSAWQRADTKQVFWE